MRKRVGWILTMGLLVSGCMAAREAGRRAVQREIAGQVVRFHVLANSDSDSDQQIKLKVRDAVLAETAPLLAGSGSRDEAWRRLSAHLVELENAANRALARLGSGETATAFLGVFDFPEKSYGEYTLPPGPYEALQIRIGRARGRNWWCMLYPALCFTDAVHAEPEEEGEEQLKEGLSARAWRAIRKKEGVTFGFYWF